MSTNGLQTKIGTFRHKIVIGGLDLTEYVLSGSIKKSISEPTGTWMVLLRPILGQDDNLPRSIPIALNDLAELRLGRDPDGTIPVVMRGFVDNEEFTEKPSQGLDGSPSRSHMLSGSDLGKMLERRQIAVPPDITKEAIDSYVANRVGLPQEVSKSISPVEIPPLKTANARYSMPISAWANYFIMKVYATDYENMVKSSTGQTNYTVNAKFNLPLTTPNGPERLFVTIAPLLNNFTGSFWSAIEYYCKKPFIEVFTEDTENATTINVRWCPHKAKRADGTLEYPVQHSNNMPWFIPNLITQYKLNSSDIIERRLRRQENDRCTYFFTNFNSYLFGQGAASAPSPSLFDNTTWSNPYYDKAGIDQFGYRPMMLEVPWFASYQKNEIKYDPTGTYSIGVDDSYVLDLKFILKDLNKWAVETLSFTDQLYSGYIVIPGNTNFKIGGDLHIEDTGEEFYIESVEHSWSVFPQPQFVTRLGLTRGAMPANFINDRANFPIAGASSRVKFGTFQLDKAAPVEPLPDWRIP